ncbi:dicarboxylate/amino acid:cation symporter [Panacagrimonas perspica]|nr:dicarboxylate/amino acid:cation symporter [Panacagrimonas perspica]THD01540.1 dicarboxylate/amino acid:cation symporter [Panacagrimonas perspica]
MPALHWQVAAALVAAAVAGSLIGPQPDFIAGCTFVGKIFLNALKMVVVPLIVAAIISGLSSVADAGGLGRMGLKTLGYYLGTGLLAIVVGLLFINLLSPGIIDGKPAGPSIGLAQDTQAVVGKIEDKGAGEFLKVFELMFPPNIIEAAADGQMLGLICFSLLFGAFIMKLPEKAATVQRQFWSGLYDVMTGMTRLIMMFAPIGVFGLVSPIIAQTGWAAAGPLAKFVAAVLLALSTHMFITLPLVLRFVARVSPLAHFRAMWPAITTAFSTSSSAATLPVTIQCMEDKAGVPKSVTSFVLPIGTTVNTDGSALYEGAVVMFIAQCYGIDLSFGAQFLIVSTALLTAIGVAGIPSASLVAIAVILGAVGLPLEGIGLVLAVDRVLDMCRTSVNVFGDSCCAVTVARLEGEDGVLGEPSLRASRQA